MKNKNIKLCSETGCYEPAVAIGREAQTLCQEHYDEHLNKVLVINFYHKFKVRHEDNFGAILIDYEGKEFFIAMEDISSVATDLICILNKERLLWRETANG